MFIVVDALGECNDSSGDCQQFFRAMQALQEETGAKLFVNSRDQKIVVDFDTTILEIRANEDDMKIFLDSRLKLLPPDLLDREIHDRISRGIRNLADGKYVNVPIQHSSVDSN